MNIFAEEFVNRYVENLRQLLDLIRTQSHRMALS